MQSQLGLANDAFPRRAPSSRAHAGSGKAIQETRHPDDRRRGQAIRDQHAFTSGRALRRAEHVTVFDPAAGRRGTGAKLCIDQYEYPNIACDYPVTWVKSDQAEPVQAQGKRLCDAHEWEGACAGALHTPESRLHVRRAPLDARVLAQKSRELVGVRKKRDLKLCATAAKEPQVLRAGWSYAVATPIRRLLSRMRELVRAVYDSTATRRAHGICRSSPKSGQPRPGTGENEMKGSWGSFTARTARRRLPLGAPRLARRQAMADDAHRTTTSVQVL